MKNKKEIKLTTEELKTLIQQTVSKSYREGIQYAIDVLTKLKKEIDEFKSNQ